MSAPPDPSPSASAGSPGRHLGEIAGAFLKLGLTSFGGPIAHLGYFHAEIVRRRRWVDEAEYADLVALCQFLPGPASSQAVFALGMRRGGLAGALTASLCFTLPSALLMIGFAYGLAALTGPWAVGVLHGLKLAAVAVVAQAVWLMGWRLCPDWPRLLLAALAAAVVIAAPLPWVQVGVIALAALSGWVWLTNRSPAAAPSRAPSATRQHAFAAAALVLCALLLVALPILARTTGNKDVQVFDSFYRSGALVFGGGHVVMPLLRAQVVPPGWISDPDFLAGYGLVQAVPGPLFTFAGYLGTVIHGAPQAWVGGVMCLFALFLPAWLLVGGTLPFWNLLRTLPGAQGALRGANAAVVGVLLAALYHPVWTEGVRGPRDVLVAAVAFALLQLVRVPPWVVVIFAALAGPWALGQNF